MRGSSPSRPSTRPRSRSPASSSTRAAGAAPSPRPSCSRCSPTTSAATRGRRGRPRKPMRFDRRLIPHFEWLLPLLALGVSGLGAMTVYSATHVPGMHGLSPLALRQLLWLAGGSVAMLTALIFDYRRLERSAFVVYVLVLLAVLAVPLLGRVGGGSRRWIPLGPVSIQPSEFMKLGLVLVLARHFARSYERGLGLRAAVVPLLLTAVPAAAILAQPDLGTVAILGIVSLTMLMLGGIVIATRARDRFGVLLVLGLTAIVFWQAVINVGMTTGLLPVVGIPLPFFSYGGSSLLCLLVGVGLAMNVSMRRYFF